MALNFIATFFADVLDSIEDYDVNLMEVNFLCVCMYSNSLYLWCFNH